jgi:RND family efflux transporter MFP subunit
MHKQNGETLRPCTAALACCIAALSGCQTGPPPASIQTVTATTVKQVTEQRGERYSASINPNAQVQLMFKSGGVVDYIREVKGPGGTKGLIDAGDAIEAGQDLAHVRTKEYDAQLHQLQSQVLQTDAQLQAAQAADTQAKLNYDRANVLYSQASLTKPSYDQAKASYDQAEASVAQAKAAGAASRAAMAQVQVAVGDTAVRAPFNGSVAQRNIEIGDLAGTASAAFTVIDTHVVKAVFAIPESALGSVHRGQQLAITLDTPPQTVRGIVTSIAPTADPKSRVFTVQLTIPNPRNVILPGTIGSLALVPSGEAVSRVLVPLSAVVPSPHSPRGLAVLLVEDRDGHTHVRSQDIQAGETYGNAVEVESGVTPGQRIVTEGAQLVHDGQEVRILQAE